VTTEREAMRRRLLDKIVNAANASAVQRKRRPPWPKHARRCIVLRSKISMRSSDASTERVAKRRRLACRSRHLASSAIRGSVP
jgi:hypothetical protein